MDLIGSYLLFLQTCIMTPWTILSKYDSVNSPAMSKIVDKLPEASREEFETLIVEGHIVTKNLLQSALVVMDA